MPNPLIGITTYDRQSYVDAECGSTFFLPCDYVEAVRRSGGVPILLPPGETRIDEILSAIHGVMIAGGGDVDPARYGQPWHAKVAGVDAERDEFEIALIRAAVERSIPVFGICRGAQIANVAFGGSLIQHVPDAVDGSIAHVSATGDFIDHAISFTAHSKLSAIFGANSCVASSSHHQAIRDVGTGMVVTAVAADGIVEAIERPSHPWFVAVQWHPERAAAASMQKRLFDDFVRACSRL
jgi:putative glutamine amidotransferase